MEQAIVLFLKAVRNGEFEEGKKKTSKSKSKRSRAAMAYRAGKQKQISYRCEICNVTCSSAFDLNCHFNGKRHKENESNTLVDLESNKAEEQTTPPDSELELLLNRVHEVAQKDDVWLSNILHNTKCIPRRPATCDTTVDVQEKQRNQDSPFLDLLSTNSPNQTTPDSSHSGTTTAKRKHSPCQATKAKRITSADTDALVDSFQGTP